jgi:general secretion pathway protein N
MIYRHPIFHAALVANLLAAAPLLLAAPSDLDANTVQRDITAPMADPVQGGIMAPAVAPAARTPEPAGSERQLRGNPLWAIPMRLLSATRERPIFVPSRRPPAPAVAGPAPIEAAPPPPPPTGPDRPQLALVGAVAGGTEGIAVFIDETTRDIVRLRTGESHAGWVLRSVRGREATLEKGPETTILALPSPTDPQAGPRGRPGEPGGPEL